MQRRIVGVQFFSDFFVIKLDNRVRIRVPCSMYRRLSGVKRSDLLDCEIWGDGTSLHWEILNEDLSLEGILLDIQSKSFVI